MVNVLFDGKRTAIKNYSCDAGEFICEHIGNSGDEDCIHECTNIKRGHRYRSQVCTDGGDIWNFRTCLPCEEFIKNNDVDITGD